MEEETGSLYRDVFGEDGNPALERMLAGQVDDTRVERTNFEPLCTEIDFIASNISWNFNSDNHEFFDDIDMPPNQKEVELNLAEDINSTSYMLKCFPQLIDANPCIEKPVLLGLSHNRTVKKANGKPTLCFRVWYCDDSKGTVRMGNLNYRRWSSKKGEWSASVACCQKSSFWTFEQFHVHNDSPSLILHIKTSDSKFISFI